MRHHPQNRQTPISGRRAAGYEGSDRNFRRLVAQSKHCGAKSIIEVDDPQLNSRRLPGHRLGHRRRHPPVLRGTRILRGRFVAFADEDEATTTTLTFIAQTLEVIDAAPTKVLADRMGCLKGGVVANVVVAHRNTCGSQPTTASPALLPRC